MGVGLLESFESRAQQHEFARDAFGQEVCSFSGHSEDTGRRAHDEDCQNILQLVVSVIHDLMNIADMVLCTTTIAASTETSILRSRAELTSFNEAAACAELEVLAAWSRGSCILAGDDSQLPPTIMSDN